VLTERAAGCLVGGSRGDDLPGVGQRRADDVEERGVVDPAVLGGVEDGGRDIERHGENLQFRAGQLRKR